MNKIDLYNQIFDLFLDSRVPQKILQSYIDGLTDDAHEYLIDEIGHRLKSEFYWTTNIAILDIADLAIKEGVSNGNLKI